jgi:molecular chaperone DnaJ
MASPQRDYYDVLGVPREADAKAIKDAFRKLALRYHPDRNKEPGAEEKFKEIAAAYAVLSDPAKRAQYDARGFAGVAGFSPEDLFGGIDFEDLFGGLGFEFGGIGGGGLFDRLFRGRRRRGRAHGENLEVGLKVSLERVLRGGEERLSVRRRVACAPCQGSGAKAGTSPEACKACGGTGRHMTERKEGAVSVRQITVCSACLGRGTIIREVCPTCGGGGSVEREETLSLSIPVGVEDGMMLRVAGRGEPSRERGGAPGDLFVIVRTEEDPRFERVDGDLWRSETIAVADAVLGTTLEVPTLEGSVMVKVPPGTAADAVLRLRGKGLPAFGGGHRGDLNLRLRLHVPERISAEERKLWEELRDLARREGGRRRTTRGETI